MPEFTIDLHVRAQYSADEGTTPIDALRWLEGNLDLIVRPGKDVDAIEISQASMVEGRSQKFYLSDREVTH